MIDEFFVTPIYQKILDLDCSKIHQECIEYSQNNKSVTASNVGGWQSDDINQGKNSISFVHDLKHHIFEGMQVIHSTYKLDAKEMYIQNMWININGPYDYNRSHTHPGSFYSGVFYVTVPENSGKINFDHPAQTGTYNGYNVSQQLTGNRVINPNQNLLILFPSWIQHNVERNDSTDKRISISFNITIV